MLFPFLESYLFSYFLVCTKATYVYTTVQDPIKTRKKQLKSSFFFYVTDATVLYIAMKKPTDRRITRSERSVRHKFEVSVCNCLFGHAADAQSGFVDYLLTAEFLE